ncbi:MAG: class I SAM-dependent methyltransferase, partial [Dehalococcoidia bacterium]|nr:class I SAM-dependent methyltransferase [Dehalococcoidia bacterium]
GLVGPARTLAVEFDCHVTVIDLTESYVQAVREPTTRSGLTGQVTHRVATLWSYPSTTVTSTWCGHRIAA